MPAAKAPRCRLKLVMNGLPGSREEAAVPLVSCPTRCRDTSLHLFQRQEGKPQFLNVWSKMRGGLRLRQRCHSRPHFAPDGFKEAIDHPLGGFADQRSAEPHDSPIGFAVGGEAQ